MPPPPLVGAAVGAAVGVGAERTAAVIGRGATTAAAGAAGELTDGGRKISETEWGKRSPNHNTQTTRIQ